MERVKQGQQYWFINTNAGITEMWVDWDVEGRYPFIDEIRFNGNNYFQTCAEAESMARKFRAVLKGADVIEMPNEEEWKQIANSLNSGFEDSQSSGIREAYNYLKSKIVK